jgi:hypothetical protein
VILHGRSLAAAVPAALALIAPAAAGAACAQRPLEQIAREVPVVVTAKAQPGPVARNGLGLLSPATFKVVAYDQGSGPQEIKVRTALTEDPGGLAAMSEGVNPIAGQTWRLWGTLGADGVLQTNVCLGSTLAGFQQTPSLVSGRRTTTLRAASLAGVPRAGQPPTLTVPRGGKVVLRMATSEANFPVSQSTARSIVAVPIKRGATTTSLTSRWSAFQGVLSTKLTAPLSGTATIVVITRGASYAARLRAG